MSKKSEPYFLDVLMKNEAKHSDMLDIMKALHDFLGKDLPENLRVISGGDQLNCERQACTQRHVMGGDTPLDRLESVEPISED